MNITVRPRTEPYVSVQFRTLSFPTFKQGEIRPRSSQKHIRSSQKQPGAARKSHKQPGPARSSQKQRRASRSKPAAARSSQKQPEAARSSQEQPAATSTGASQDQGIGKETEPGRRGPWNQPTTSQSHRQEQQVEQDSPRWPGQPGIQLEHKSRPL